MKRSPKTRRRRILDVLALLLIMIVARRSRGQVADWSQEQAAPAWSLAIPRLRYAETDVEIEQDNYDSPGSGGHIHSNNYYISPRLGLEWKNYIYHPYLLNYSLLFEPSYVWQQRSQNETVNRSDDFRLNGVYAVNLLEVKP